MHNSRVSLNMLDALLRCGTLRIAFKKAFYAVDACNDVTSPGLSNFSHYDIELFTLNYNSFNTTEWYTNTSVRFFT